MTVTFWKYQISFNLETTRDSRNVLKIKSTIIKPKVLFPPRDKMERGAPLIARMMTLMLNHC